MNRKKPTVISKLQERFRKMDVGRGLYLNDDGTTEIRPCPFVLLLDSGKLEPFIFLSDDALEFMASEGVTGFVGFAPSN